MLEKLKKSVVELRKAVAALERGESFTLYAGAPLPTAVAAEIYSRYVIELLTKMGWDSTWGTIAGTKAHPRNDFVILYPPLKEIDDIGGVIEGERKENPPAAVLAAVEEVLKAKNKEA